MHVRKRRSIPETHQWWEKKTDKTQTTNDTTLLLLVIVIRRRKDSSKDVTRVVYNLGDYFMTLAIR